ncbi:MAG: TIGR03364 family FAD-dependent oxidoreductase [Bryobacterales bacterium]|nr:TIGR03364 family FAD-dependent oxidoreductase [Bryobacterales bacterium]
MPDRRADIAIIGGGILGLAHAWQAARRGLQTVVFERRPRAMGASVRNFGMVWPVGQPSGEMLETALRSRDLWIEVLDASGLPYRPTGSLHAVYNPLEEAVVREFAEIGPGRGYTCEWVEPEEALKRSSALVPDGLRGALWSPGELTVDPRRILADLPAWLAERFGVELQYGSLVRSIGLPRIETSTGVWHAERAIVCAGDEFQTLYPEVFSESGLVRVKLQMLRTVPQQGWELGPSLAAGLTLRFYKSFQICSTLPAYREWVAGNLPEYDAWGIHVLASQTADGAITLGDTHEYGDAPDLFDKTRLDELVLDYAKRFLRLRDWTVAERWHGVYCQHPLQPYFRAEPSPGVQILTGPGGSGMTLSFGLAERTFQLT